MKKKIVILILSIFLISGCTNINKSNYNDIISTVVNSRYNMTNATRRGYKYYIPNGLSSIYSNDFNEVLSSAKYHYYLYVDVVSYYNRVIREYTVNNEAYYSTAINYEDKYGYLEINKQKNSKYLVEIMYNYAKIEVMVDEQDLKEVITNSIIILSSINYNNNILEGIIGDNALEYNEENYNIFETKKNSVSNYLEVEEQDVYEDDSDQDPDLVDVKGE